MKHLLKVIIIIAALFALTFLLLKTTGFLSGEQIKTWLLSAKELSPLYVGGIVVLMRFSDLFIAIPTMTVITLAGYFLGFLYGAIASIIGMTLAGISGYWLSTIFGERIFDFLLKKEEARQEAKATFRQHGFVMILLSLMRVRSVPLKIPIRPFIQPSAFLRPYGLAGTYLAKNEKMSSTIQFD